MNQRRFTTSAIMAGLKARAKALLSACDPLSLVTYRHSAHAIVQRKAYIGYGSAQFNQKAGVHKVKIATMVRGSLTIPPPKDILYPPMSIALATAKGLIQRGHEVTFFGPLGSNPPGNLQTENLA